MRMPIRLVPQGIIPRDPNLVMRMRRLPAVTVAAQVADEEEVDPGVTIGAGADNFADATEISFEEFRDVVAAYTYNKALTVEDDETGNTEVFDASYRTAWWKLTVPPDLFCIVDVDTSLSFGSEPGPGTEMASPPNRPDTNLGIWEGTLDDLQAAQNGTDGSSNEDRSGIDYTSMVRNILLEGGEEGRTFYIQVGQYTDGPDICYVMRMSLRFAYPWTIPADGVDPTTV